MPVRLPDGARPTFRALNDDQVLTAGVREQLLRFEMVDAKTGTTLGVLPGAGTGSVEWSASSSVKGTGTLGMASVGRTVDWLQVWIRPVWTIVGFSREVPCGLWMPAANPQKWGVGVSFDVELTDKTGMLDSDIWTNPRSGLAETCTMPAGTNVVNAVAGLIKRVGGTTEAISPRSETLSKPMTWEPGTTLLQIANDILDAGNFFSLWCDWQGRFRVTKWTEPRTRPAAWEASGAFEFGTSSVVGQEMTLDHDIYAIPNRVVMIGQGTGEAAALVGQAVNTDASSPYSYQSRGRWITVCEQGVEAVDVAALQAAAKRKLDAATRVATTVSMTHALLPDLCVNDAVRLRNPLGTLDMLSTVTKTSVALDPVGTVSTDVSEVLS